LAFTIDIKQVANAGSDCGAVELPLLGLPERAAGKRKPSVN
jgi:hypothetical protein